MRRLPIVVLSFLLTSPALCLAAPACMDWRTNENNVPQLDDYNAIEFRRYPVAPGEREHFTQYFEAWFPEAFEQAGSIAFGQLYERGDPNAFTWMRGFHTIQDRAISNAAFYYGPVWQEHREVVNKLLPGDDDNVLLLRPLDSKTQIPVLPAVDPVTEPKGAQGIVVAVIYAVKKESIDAFSKQALDALAGHDMTGVHPAGVLVTLDVPNNFPQLPIRTDGPYLVTLHVVQDESVLKDSFDPFMKATEQTLTATGLLRSPPETIVMDPTGRSRLRWLPQCQ